MSNWIEDKIGNLAKINEATLKGNSTLAKIEYIDTSSVNEGIFNSPQILDIKQAPSRAKRLVKDKDILISTVRPNLKHYGIIKNPKDNTIVSTGFAVVSAKTIDPLFLYYFLSSEFATNYFALIAENQTSAYPSFNPELIRELKISFPKKITNQNKIGSILLAYDNLIETNNQRIRIIEQTARELYKEWFVRMRFPEFKKSKFKKGIPTDWRIEPIGKVIDYHIGGGWGNDSKDNQFSVSGYVIRGTDIPKVRAGQANQDVYRFHKASNMKSRELIEGDIVFETAGGSEGQPLGRTCYITQEILDAYGDKVMAASFCKQVRTTSIPSLYLYYFLNYLYDTGMIETYQIQSTGISNYQFEPFLKFQQIILPKEDLMKSFHDMVLPMQKQIAVLGNQNTELRQIRDRLLPRLISGKLQVKAAKEEGKVIPLKPTQGSSAETESMNKSNPYFKRRILAAYLIDHLKDEITFGHVKLMKLMYLCEHLAKVETLSNYHRDAAGPYDNQMIRSIDSQLKKAKWFECVKIDQKYTYKPLEKKEEYKPWFTKYYSEEETGIESLLSIFGKKKTIEAEKVATLYEACRFLKEKNKTFTDKDVVHEVLNNWHESKQRISENDWQTCLNWMREKNWVN